MDRRRALFVSTAVSIGFATMACGYAATRLLTHSTNDHVGELSLTPPAPQAPRPVEIVYDEVLPNPADTGRAPIAATTVETPAPAPAEAEAEAISSSPESTTTTTDAVTAPAPHAVDDNTEETDHASEPPHPEEHELEDD